MAADPYRILGLPSGAPSAEVKRAYRRLAKANHPDSAGEGALPRFLEIQRAYDALTTVAWRPGTRRSASTSPAEPWRADPRRARSTPGSEWPGAGPRGGSTAGTKGGSGRRAGTGADQGSAAGPEPAPPGGAARSERARSEGSATRRRSTKKATFGSTTYDEAHEQVDSTWSGASWYGQTSGEYWRVNPREYADPRKHGPEYMSRAADRAAAAAERRARQGTVAEPVAGAGARPGPDPDGRSRPDPHNRSRPAAPVGGDGQTPRDRPAAFAASPPHRARGTEPPPPAAASASSASAAGWDPGAWLPFALSPGMRRIFRALVAWPPLGIAAAAAIGEATGCAAFEAICTPPADLYPWFAQGAIVLALFALPGAARILAGGTLAVAILAFPVTAVLSAGGANYDRTYGPVALIAVLGVAWAVGVVAAFTRRVVTRWLP